MQLCGWKREPAGSGGSEPGLWHLVEGLGEGWRWGWLHLLSAPQEAIGIVEWFMIFKDDLILEKLILIAPGQEVMAEGGKLVFFFFFFFCGSLLCPL